MAVIQVKKATTPGQRGMVNIVSPELYKGPPVKGLTVKKVATNGRNNAGRITVRHRGGGVKRHIRTVDFKRYDKKDIPAVVERFEYDPGRSANLALLKYADGERRYVIAPKGLKEGKTVVASEKAPIEVGNSLSLKNIPVGTVVHNIELKPGKGAQLARSAGAGVQLMAREGGYATIRLRSGEMRMVPAVCWATIGEVGNAEHSLRRIGKAGKKRLMGIRPTVRGVAMNPVDHPLGGGEGRTSGGRHPCSPTGKTEGIKTRKRKKWTDRFIVRRRRSKSKK